MRDFLKRDGERRSAVDILRLHLNGTSQQHNATDGKRRERERETGDDDLRSKLGRILFLLPFFLCRLPKLRKRRRRRRKKNKTKRNTLIIVKPGAQVGCVHLIKFAFVEVRANRKKIVTNY